MGLIRNNLKTLLAILLLLNVANSEAQISGKWYLFECTHTLEPWGTETDYFVLKFDSADQTFNLLNYSKTISLKGNEYSRDKFVCFGSYEYSQDSADLRLIPASTVRTFEQEGKFFSDSLQNPENKTGLRYLRVLNRFVFYIECDSSEKYKYPTGLFFYENMAALGTVTQTQISFLDSTFFYLNYKDSLLFPSYTPISAKTDISVRYVVRSETNLNREEFARMVEETDLTKFFQTEEDFRIEMEREKIVLFSKGYSDFKSAYQTFLVLEIKGLMNISIVAEETDPAERE